MYGSHDIGNDQELLKGVKKCDLEIRVRYRMRSESIATTIWWLTYGESAPELQRIAVKILSQTTSSSHCERNGACYKRLHSIVYLRYDMKLKIRHLSRQSNDEINASLDPINLDYIFHEDDPLNE
ncbi:Long chain acyl-CoA synthetase 7 peroxisomal [Bienertia sinuspersici]